MRTIKFRGKSVETGKWVYGSLINNMFFRSETREAIPYIVDTNQYEDYDSFFDTEHLAIEVHPESVGQYADVPNREDKGFFEGDIIRVSDPSSAHRIQVVVFKDGGFCGYSELKSSPYTWLDTLIRANTIVEVIGNVHDNPELVEGKGIVHNTR